MASDGTRVFVLGGISSAIAQGDENHETALIHVLDTSTYFVFVISFGQPQSLKTQSAESTRIPILTMSSLVRRTTNSHGIHPQVPQPGSNPNTRRPLYRMLTRHTVLLVSKELLPKTWVAPPPRRLLVNEFPVRMACHRNPRV
jgi:hypothetical protein